MQGVLGESLTTEQGKRSAAQTAFNVLATLRCDSLHTYIKAF